MSATSVANDAESAQEGRVDALKLLHAIEQGGDRERLLKDTVDKITTLRDMVRMNAFLRAMQKGRHQ